MEKPRTINLRKWHFLFLGSALVLLAWFLWYWNWRAIGLPVPLQPEHYLTIAAYVVGVFVLCVFIFRLTKAQVTITLVWLILVNLILALVTAWIIRDARAFFDAMRPVELSEYDPAYIANWGRFFLMPMIYAAHSGLLLLLIESLVMFFIRKPDQEPG